MKQFNRYLITAALPYANGPVHIGHLAGCYLPSDIYVRYLRATGADVKFIGGTDEHGVPITIKAMKEGVTPQDIVDKYYAIIRDSFAAMGISFDIFRAPRARSIMKRRLRSLQTCMIRACLKRRRVSNIMMK
ncbi:class I tRNA ligase family protein [Chitinophaga sedimenti]|nr:class I tRNA ligase family protein [Chitinophaga sedimenti]MCK7557632.1 class I tRNA ligase family protein [Chitinophaga sedimenti]